MRNPSGIPDFKSGSIKLTLLVLLVGIGCRGQTVEPFSICPHYDAAGNKTEPTCDNSVIAFGKSLKLIRDLFPEECGGILKADAPKPAEPQPDYKKQLACLTDPPDTLRTKCILDTQTPPLPIGGHDCGAITCSELAADLLSHCHIERYDPGYDPDASHIDIGWPPTKREPSWQKATDLRIVCGGQENK